MSTSSLTLKRIPNNHIWKTLGVSFQVLFNMSLIIYDCMTEREKNTGLRFWLV